MPDERGAAPPHPAGVARARSSPSSAGRTSGFSIPDGGDLCPACRFVFKELMTEYKGDFAKVIEHVRVQPAHALARRTASASAPSSPRTRRTRTRPSSPATSTTARSPSTARDSDPRAFNFDGEFNIANRGIIEFVEVLKLDVAFLYDLLGASQEHKIKPKKFPQTDIDEVIIGHTNEPEYKKLQNNEFMEALRDRTVKIDIPYITKLAEEMKIYEKDFNAHRIRGKHIAPHTLEMAAMWAVLTRLEEPKKHNLTLLAEAQALQRQDAARLHRGQHQGAAQGGARARAWRASARATCRTRSPTRWSATRARAASTRSWC